MPGSSAESNVNDGETAKRPEKIDKDALSKKETEETSKESGDTAKKAVKDSTVKDVVKDVNDKDQKINDKVTEDQFGRDITGPKSERTEPNRLEQGNRELHGNRPQDSADFANKNKITGPDLVSPGEKGSESGSTPPSQPPLASGQGAGAGMPGLGGGGGGTGTGNSPNSQLPPNGGIDQNGSGGSVTPPVDNPVIPPGESITPNLGSQESPSNTTYDTTQNQNDFLDGPPTE